MVDPQKMLPPDLLQSLSRRQLEALIASYEIDLATLRVRLECALYSERRRADNAARAERARAARSHDCAERKLIIWKLYRRGLSDAEIATRTGCGRRTVQRALRALALAG